MLQRSPCPQRAGIHFPSLHRHQSGCRIGCLLRIGAAAEKQGRQLEIVSWLHHNRRPSRRLLSGFSKQHGRTSQHAIAMAVGMGLLTLDLWMRLGHCRLFRLHSAQPLEHAEGNSPKSRNPLVTCLVRRNLRTYSARPGDEAHPAHPLRPWLRLDGAILPGLAGTSGCNQ